MKVVNQCDNSVYLNDVDVIVPFSQDGTPFEISDDVANKSITLSICLAKGMLFDVEKGTAMPGAFMKKKSMLCDDNPRLPQDAILNEDKKPMEFFPDDVYAAWHGPAYDYGGYANMNRRFMFGLNEAGVRIRYDKIQSINDADMDIVKRLEKLSMTKIPKWAPKIYGMTAPLHYDWSRYKMLFTMMETRRLHPHYTDRCNCADEIIVPSRWCKQEFEESGVKRPITVVPLGVNTDLYRPGVEPIGFSKSLKDFVFVSVFGWSMRKGYDVLLKAYFEEFTSDDPVSLLIMSRYYGSTDESKKKVIREDIQRMASLVSNTKKPHVMLFGDTLSEEMMPSLYAAADCYVLISRGEGFGLPYCEASACGLPVIASRYSGQTDFLDNENSYLVDVDGYSKAEKDISWISYFYEGQEFPTLGPKAVEQTRVHMRSVFENYAEAERKAALLRSRIVKEYDWSVGIRKMQAELKRVNEERKAK